MKRTRAIILLSVVLCLSAAAQTSRPTQNVPGGVPAGVAGAPVVSAALRQETFDIVWRTVKEKHFDPEHGGVDWDKVREQYLPRASAAKSDSEFYAVLRQMLGELQQSHFNIIPPKLLSKIVRLNQEGEALGSMFVLWTASR